MVREIRIPSPHLPLQQSFATRVQAIEALKTQHRAALAALNALFASLQQRAFAGGLCDALARPGCHPALPWVHGATRTDTGETPQFFDLLRAH